MKKELFGFLKGYTTDEGAINRLIVSSYLSSKKVNSVVNTFINSLLIKETDSEYEILQAFNEKFVLDTLEKVIEAFEFVISPEDKVVSGAVYTPAPIRAYIVDEVFSGFDDVEGKTVCDPACGCAGFLFSSIKKFRDLTHKTYKDIIEQNIYGLDVKEYAIQRSKILLTLLAIDNGEDPHEINFNLFVGNALSNNWDKYVDGFTGFDIVVGNPPYVCSRNIDEESRKLLRAWKVSSTGHPDLYIPFFELGITILKEGGYLGFITMNSFFKSLNGRALRNYFNDHRYAINIIDFGGEQVFSSNSTYTCICLIEKVKSHEVKYVCTKPSELEHLAFDSIPYELLENQAGWNLKSGDLISKIEAVGKPFSTIFKSSSGVATLKNDVYIFDAEFEDDHFYYIDENTPIEKSICREIVNTNKLTKVKNIDQLKRKIIFPYYYENTKAILYSEQVLSAKYPKAYAHLLSKKDALAKRDKGKGKYEEWYAYGRRQSLEKYKYKLFFPHIASDIPYFILSEDCALLFYNGLSLLDNSLNKLKLAQKIMRSRLFWFYIKKTSKAYSSGYMSISKNYFKSFGVYDFTEQEKAWLIAEESQNKIDAFLESKYEVEVSC